MHELLPIIRRKRRSLIVEAEATPLVPVKSVPDETPEPVAEQVTTVLPEASEDTPEN